MMLMSVAIVSTASATLPPPPATESLKMAFEDASGLTSESHATSLEIELPPWTDLPPLNEGMRSMYMQDGKEDTTAATSKASAPAFGAAGSKRWSVVGNWGIDVKSSSNMEYGIGLGLQWFLVDDFAFAPALRLWGFSQEGENAFGGSLDLLFQWHVIKGEGWTIYGDFGCGMLGTNHNVPSDGSQFNFTPQAGFGATFDVGNDRRWIIGVRWHHISNATLYQNNPGRDSILMYTGLSLPF